jgi:hypothetical protein
MLALCLVIVFLECWKILVHALPPKFIPTSCLVNRTLREAFFHKAAIPQVTSFVIIVCGVHLEIPVFTSH